MRIDHVAACLFVCVASLLTFSASASAQTSDWEFCAVEGGVCAFTGTQEVRYGEHGSYVYKTVSDGTACANWVFGDPLYGTPKTCAVRGSASGWTLCAWETQWCAFAGTTDVRYGANGSYHYTTASGGITCANGVFGDPAPGVTKQCDVWTTAATTSLPPPPTSSYGPTPNIACPGGAVDIWPGSSIQQTVGLHPASTAFCLRAGVHWLTSSIIPKTGNTFVGEYGAVLDGSGWATSDDTQAAFRGHNQDIDYVTIRNLVIRNMPQRGIHAFHYLSDHWTVEYNEIASNRLGVVFPSDSVIKNNFIHHNVYSGYMGVYAHNSTLETNEIAYNGWEQKVSESDNVTFRNNFVHHNTGAGIWYDSNNRGALIEGNRVEDNGHVGIWYEISSDASIRNNAVRRNGDTGVFISTSKNTQIYNNTIEDNFRGIVYFVNCPSVGGGWINFDLANNSAYDNMVTVGTRSGAFASGFSYGSCTSTQAALYLNGWKGLSFSRNTYYVPSTSGQYWLWAAMKYWNEWQSFGQDLDGVSR